MCGRYALSFRVSYVRSRLANQHMDVEEAPDDDDMRSTYNFAPGYHGLIYRAQTADRHHGSQETHDQGDDGDQDEGGDDDNDDDDEPSPKKSKRPHPSSEKLRNKSSDQETKYKLQTAKWGLIPFWTKRPPDYGGQMRTINCRDDSLLENRGMWNVSKQRKRCIVICEGFYEWLKKNNGKEKIPHFVKRKDGELMTFAGLWDMVQYEGSEEKLYSYTIITTDSNKQLKFLHDRMPVILEPGSEAMKRWLDPNNVGWSKDLQSMLKPYKGELECYPVDKAVGKVGNNSATFVVPIDSKENKSNIANFFGNQQAKAKAATANKEIQKLHVKEEPDEDRKTTTKVESTEDNAPIPKIKGETDEYLSQRINEDADQLGHGGALKGADGDVEKKMKRELSDVEEENVFQGLESPPRKTIKTEHSSPPIKNSPAKTKTGGKNTRSATNNGTVAKTPVKEGNAKITSFFGK